MNSGVVQWAVVNAAWELHESDSEGGRQVLGVWISSPRKPSRCGPTFGNWSQSHFTAAAIRYLLAVLQPKLLPLRLSLAV